MAERKLFNIDPKTVEIDLATTLPIAKGMDGKTKYSFWGLVSRELYHANVEILEHGIYGLGVSLEDIRRDFIRYRNGQSLHGLELELGVAAVFSAESEGINFLHKDLGIWVKAPEIRRITTEDRLRVMRDLGRQQLDE